MQSPIIHYICNFTFLVIGAFGLMDWYTFDGKVPEDLTPYEGSVAFTKALATRNSYSVQFSLSGSSRVFLYPSILPNPQGIKIKLDSSSKVFLLAKDGDVWSLAIDGINVLTEEESLSGRASNSRIGLWLGLVCLGFASYLLLRKRRHR
ncbi:LPXTG cell wall anchor domain-containing protein [Microbulbifer aggregans]|uniref:LPXTG cell wall anchor domain-containing protein n=1 Tax=Microbulbifer aggregans TaxID=1769779 RepID=UPI001CFC9391|nr:LPXTG cell wall anchor domain-containing protein [Microbulbifer aggregans]